MGFITVDKMKCTRDSLCVQECPMGIITINGSSFPEEIEEAEKHCVKCGHCVAVCPHGALSLEGIRTEDCTPIQKELHLSVAQVEQLIKSRRSIRKYHDKQIEQEKLEKLLDIARYAPTGRNSQLVEWVVINSREEVKKLAGATIEFMKGLIAAKHPLSERYQLGGMIKEWDEGVDRIFRSAPALVVAHGPKEYGLAKVDCTIALSYLDLAATALGLGTCWAGFFMIASNESKFVQNHLSLPEGNVCVGGLMIGYPKYMYRTIPPRKEAKVVWR